MFGFKFFKHPLALVLALAAFLVPAQAQDQIAYTTQIQGVDDPDLLASLEQLSDAVNQEADPPATVAALRRRVTRDLGRFQKALQAAGYYGATVRAEVRGELPPVQVVYEIVPGVLYPFGKVEVVPAPDAPADAHLPAPEALGLAVGAPATAGVIMEAERRLLDRLRESGHPFPLVKDRVVIADHHVQHVEVRFEVDAGGEAVFGAVEVQGLETLDPIVVLDALPWERGAPFQQSQVAAAEKALYLLNLFSVVAVRTGDLVNDAGEVPIVVEVTERKHRTIAGGIAYTTDYGAGVEGRWEHRNFGGKGQRLSFETHLNRLLMDFRGEYHVPRWRRLDQALTFDFEVAQEDTDAFKSERIATRAWVRREVTERTTLALGVGLRFSEVEQQRFSSQYRLLSLHGRVEWDNTDDKLDPSRGARLHFEVAPYFDIWGGDSRFLRSEFSASTYLGFGKNLEGSEQSGDADAVAKPVWVLALRTRLGAIASYEPEHVPPDIRFYAGGGGSVRGYPFQNIGPVDENDPLGGRSVIEAAIEIRRRINQRLGMVAFVDGGMVYAPTIPDFEEEPRIGAGLGLRYFTPLGPMRLDFAVPVNPPDHVDAPFQVYLSIGQAF